MAEHVLAVNASPHIRSGVTTQKIMLDVIIALFPATAASVWLFGPRALLVITASVLCCVFFEWGTQKLFGRKCTVSDLSAVVTGMLLAMSLPSTVPLWLLPIGAFFAIAVTKQLFGGIGQNFANPAIVARIVLFVSFASHMTSYPLPQMADRTADAVASATPLAEGAAMPSAWELFLGTHGGCIGETCAAALLLGMIWLVARRVIALWTPVAFVGSAVLFGMLFGAAPLHTVLTGGLLLGAIFMATDYATTPSTPLGKVIFGVGCGLVTAVIRAYGAYPEGVSFAILLMNVLTPLIDRYIRQKPFGAAVKKEG